MSRTVPASLLAAWAGDVARPYFAVEFLLTGTPQLPSVPLRFWSGYGDRTIGVNVYTGAGELISISGLEEVNDMSAKALTISLSGMSGTVISMALQEPYQRRKCRVYFGDTSVADVVEVFTGSLNKMTIADSADSGTVTVLVDSKMVEADRSSNRRYTSESQKARFSGDTFFDYVAPIQDSEISWGRKSS
tara:strand:- start:4822 stop:5391 length:570 start_codon:yes stop_codon:yes gene_type:complete